MTERRQFNPADYPAALPHESLEEIFADLYVIHGSARIGPAMRMNRNMTVVRQNGELTVINPVHLNSMEEARLDRLGKVRHVVRIGYYHGLDDGYYVERYGAEFWSSGVLIATPRWHRRAYLTKGLRRPSPTRSFFASIM